MLTLKIMSLKYIIINERTEPKSFIKFCHTLCHRECQTIKQIQRAFGDDSMGKTQMKVWYNFSKHGNTLMKNRCAIIQEIKQEVGIRTGSTHSILTDILCIRTVSAKVCRGSRSISAQKTRGFQSHVQSHGARFKEYEACRSVVLFLTKQLW